MFLPDEFRLTNDTPEKTHLDFTRNRNHMSDWFALIPDYHTKSYVPAIKGLYEQSSAYTFGKSTILDYSKNSAYVDSVFCNPDDRSERCFVQPFVFRELKRLETHDQTLDWQKAGTDFFNRWKRYGDSNRVTGAEILSRGFAFMALVSYDPILMGRDGPFR